MYFSMEPAEDFWMVSFPPSLSLCHSLTLHSSPFPTSVAIPSWLSPEGKLDGNDGNHPGNYDTQVLVPALLITN